MRRALPIGALALASCAAINPAPYDAPTYSYQDIDLSGVLSGRLEIRDNCLVLIEPEGHAFHLIWPDRSSFTSDGVLFDNGKMSRRIALGSTIRLFGGFNNLSPANASSYGAENWLGEAFLINSVKPAS